MKVTTTVNQAECIEILETFGITDAIVPKPPARATTGMVQIDNTSWLVAENNAGTYRIHFVENATKHEAWLVFDSTFQGSGINPRITYVGPSQNAVNN